MVFTLPQSVHEVSLFNTNYGTPTPLYVSLLLLKRTIIRTIIPTPCSPLLSPPNPPSKNEGPHPSPSLASYVPSRPQSVPASLLQPPVPLNLAAPTQSTPKPGIRRHAPRPSLPYPTSSSRPYPQRRKPCNISRPFPWPHACPANKIPA